MTFAIRPLKIEDLDRIFSEKNREALAAFTHRRSWWSEALEGTRWSVDPEIDAYLMMLPPMREVSGTKYVFGLRDDFLVIRNMRYGVFSFEYIAPPLLQELDRVKEIIRTAFRHSGQFINGVTDPKHLDAVPNAQFVDRSETAE